MKVFDRVCCILYVYYDRGVAFFELLFVVGCCCGWLLLLLLLAGWTRLLVVGWLGVCGVRSLTVSIADD